MIVDLVFIAFLAAGFGASLTLYNKTDHDGPSRTAAGISIGATAVASVIWTALAMVEGASAWALAVVLVVSAEVGHRLTVYADGGLTVPIVTRGLHLLAWVIVLSAVAWHRLRAALGLSSYPARC